MSPLASALVRLSSADTETTPEALAEGLDLPQQATLFNSALYRAFLQNRFKVRVADVQTNTAMLNNVRCERLRELLDSRELLPAVTAGMQFALALCSESQSKLEKLKGLLMKPKAQDFITDWPAFRPEWMPHAAFAVGNMQLDPTVTVDATVAMFKQWRKLGLASADVQHSVAKSLYVEAQHPDVQGKYGERCFKEMMAIRLSIEISDPFPAKRSVEDEKNRLMLRPILLTNLHSWRSCQMRSARTSGHCGRCGRQCCAR